MYIFTPRSVAFSGASAEKTTVLNLDRSVFSFPARRNASPNSSGSPVATSVQRVLVNTEGGKRE